MCTLHTSSPLSTPALTVTRLNREIKRKGEGNRKPLLYLLLIEGELKLGIETRRERERQRDRERKRVID